MLPTKTYKNLWSPKMTKQIFDSTYFREQGKVLIIMPVSMVSCAGLCFATLVTLCRDKSSITEFPSYAHCCVGMYLSTSPEEIKF